MKLTGRKIVQLGLSLVGPAAPTKGSTNHAGSIYKFTPHVWVSAVFVRDGVEERLEAGMEASANVKEYDDALLEEQQEQDKIDTTYSAPVSPSWFTTPSRPSRPSGPGDKQVTFAPVKLSPLLHRSNADDDKQAVLGMYGMQSLGLLLNSRDRQLEVEEEENCRYEEDNKSQRRAGVPGLPLACISAPESE